MCVCTGNHYVATTSTNKLTMAEQADRHHLYQLAVQSPEGDVELLQQVYEKCRGTRAFHFREDFCGTAVTLSRWIEQGEAFSGEGYDIDPDPLGWGQEHNFRPLGAAADETDFGWGEPLLL